MRISPGLSGLPARRSRRHPAITSVSESKRRKGWPFREMTVRRLSEVRKRPEAIVLHLEEPRGIIEGGTA